MEWDEEWRTKCEERSETIRMVKREGVMERRIIERDETKRLVKREKLEKDGTRPWTELAEGICRTHGLLHRSGHSALKPVSFVKPIFRDFATSVVRSGLALWACAV